MAQFPPVPEELPDQATCRIDAFYDRYGQAHLDLACHAAFPISLTTELLYQLWTTFQRDINGNVLNIPWIAVSDLLLSPLCEEVGHELYEIDLVVRNKLLQRLKTDLRFGQTRIQQLSDFLLAHIQADLDSPDIDVHDHAQAQRWMAVAFTHPAQTARELALTLINTYQKDESDLLRIAAIVNSLAPPLASFEPLLIYADGLSNTVRGDMEKAVNQFERVRQLGGQVEGVHLPLFQHENLDLNHREAKQEVKLFKRKFVLPIVSCLALGVGIFALSIGTWQIVQRQIDTPSLENILLDRTLSGSLGEVKCLILGPGGRSLISGGVDGVIRVWDMATGKALRNLVGHTSYINALIISPNGKNLISAGADETIRIWNLETGQNIRTLRDGSFVNTVVVSPDGKTLASGNADGTIRLWNLATGEEIATLTGHESAVNSLVYSPDGKVLISGSADSTVKLWDTKTGTVLHTLAGHTSYVNAVAVSPDARMVMSASADSTIKVWDSQTGELLRTLEGHKSFVNALRVSPDGMTVISSSADSTIKIWDLATGKLRRTLTGYGAPIDFFVVDFNRGEIATASKSRNIAIWKFR